MNNEVLFNIWRSMARSHFFDEQVAKAVEQKRVNCFVYLSSGQEAIAASIAEAFRGYKPHIFCQHRGHAAYLSFGGDPARLRDELLDGYGGDPMIHDPKINFWGHSGLVADQVPIAVGYAMATNQPVICFLGDSTVEEDVFGPALGVAAKRDLPVLFVCEDNGLSVITRTETRRSFDAVNLASAYGIDAFETLDEPAALYVHAVRFREELRPLFLNTYCCRRYRHVGIGSDGETAWDRMALTRDAVSMIDAARGSRIEAQAALEMEGLWG